MFGTRKKTKTTAINKTHTGDENKYQGIEVLEPTLFMSTPPPHTLLSLLCSESSPYPSFI